MMTVQNIQLGVPLAAIAKHEIAAHIGGSASVLPDLPVTQRDAAYRHSQMPTADSARRDWPGGRRRAQVPVDDASDVPDGR